jgi:hypothetical protein
LCKPFIILVYIKCKIYPAISVHLTLGLSVTIAPLKAPYNFSSSSFLSFPPPPLPPVLGFYFYYPDPPEVSYITSPPLLYDSI